MRFAAVALTIAVCGGCGSCKDKQPTQKQAATSTAKQPETRDPRPQLETPEVAGPDLVPAVGLAPKITLNRIIDVFPAHQQEQIRVQLSFVLEGIISQQLIPKKNGGGRVLAVEIFIPTPAIRNLIREDKSHQIYSMMQTGQTKFGMQTMNQSLFELFKKGLISYDDALSKSTIPDELINMMERASIGKG